MHDLLMDQAVKAYKAELDKPSGLRQRSARKICSDFQEIHTQETGTTIRLSYCTLIRLAAGGKTLTQARAEKCWLTPEETEIVVEYIIEVGQWGFPPSHQRLKEHVDAICRARLGNHFPKTGVGKQWTHRFMERHSG